VHAIVQQPTELMVFPGVSERAQIFLRARL
jgi:hypothetical protein